MPPRRWPWPRFHDFLTDLRRTGAWSVVLTGLERLLTGLQQRPPPIDYLARRQVGDNLDLITDAVAVGRRRHPSPVPLQTLVGQFWERFTGGDIAYAPELIRLDPAKPAYGVFRQKHGVASCDLFHVAHRYLSQTVGVAGPLIWRPGLLPHLGPVFTPAATTTQAKGG